MVIFHSFLYVDQRVNGWKWVKHGGFTTLINRNCLELGTWGFSGGTPLVNKQFAIENGPVEIVDFPMRNGGSFQFVMWKFTRPGNPHDSWWYNVIDPIISPWIKHRIPAGWSCHSFLHLETRNPSGPSGPVRSPSRELCVNLAGS